MPYAYIPHTGRGKLPCETDSRRNRQKGTAIPAIHTSKGKNEGAGKPVRPYLLNSFRTKHGEWAKTLSPRYGKEISRALNLYLKKNRTSKYRIPKTICPELFEAAREIILNTEGTDPEELGITTLDGHYVLHMQMQEEYYECSHCILSLKGLDDMESGEFRNAVMQYTAILLEANEFTLFYDTVWHNIIECTLDEQTTDGKPNDGVDGEALESLEGNLEESLQIMEKMSDLKRMKTELSPYGKMEKSNLRKLIEQTVPRNGQERELKETMLKGIDFLYEKSWADYGDIGDYYASICISPSDFCYATYSNENGACIASDYCESFYGGDEAITQPRIETWLTPEGVIARSTDRDEMVSFVDRFNEQLKKFEKNGKHN